MSWISVSGLKIPTAAMSHLRQGYAVHCQYDGLRQRNK